MPRCVLPFEEIDATSIGLVGGKGANLGELARIDGIRVPWIPTFHTEWDATHIIRAYYANAAGGSEVFTVPATMIGAHHASTNNADPSANWRNGSGQIEAITIARMHTCTYLRTR